MGFHSPDKSLARYDLRLGVFAALLLLCGCSRHTGEPLSPQLSSDGFDEPTPRATPMTASSTDWKFQPCLDGYLERGNECNTCAAQDFLIDNTYKNAQVRVEGQSCKLSHMVLYFDTSDLPDHHKITSIALTFNIEEFSTSPGAVATLQVFNRKATNCPGNLVPDQDYAYCAAYPGPVTETVVTGTGTITVPLQNVERIVNPTGATAFALFWAPASIDQPGEFLSALISTIESENPQLRPRLDITTDDNRYTACFDGYLHHGSSEQGCSPADFQANTTSLRILAGRTYPLVGLAGERQAAFSFDASDLNDASPITSAQLELTIPGIFAPFISQKRLAFYARSVGANCLTPATYDADDFLPCGSGFTFLGNLTLGAPGSYVFSIPNPEGKISKDGVTEILVLDNSIFSGGPEDVGTFRAEIYGSETAQGMKLAIFQ